MDIRNIGNGSISNLQRVKAAELSQSEQTATAAVPDKGETQRTTSVLDRVDLGGSNASRNVRSPELQFAKQALNSLPDSDAARMAEIKARIADGYYTRPDALNAVADRLASLLS